MGLEAVKDLFPKVYFLDKSISKINTIQEVENIIPEVVNTNEDGFKSVAYGNMVGLLVEAIKELKVEIEDLKK